MKVIFAILAFALLAIVAGVFMPGEGPGSRENLPWHVEATPDGGSRVFGIHLGQTTLNEAAARFGDEPKITLFSDREGNHSVEAYYDSVELAGLRASMVMNIGLSQDALRGMYRRGLRTSKAGSGARKVSLHPDDLDQIGRVPVTGITYLPRIDLEEDVLERRFGQPARRVAEPESERVHWLYPAKGLDIAVSESDREVFQYVRPDRFEESLGKLP